MEYHTFYIIQCNEYICWYLTYLFSDAASYIVDDTSEEEMDLPPRLDLKQVVRFYFINHNPLGCVQNRIQIGGFGTVGVKININVVCWYFNIVFFEFLFRCCIDATTLEQKNLTSDGTT